MAHFRICGSSNYVWSTYTSLSCHYADWVGISLNPSLTLSYDVLCCQWSVRKFNFIRLLLVSVEVTWSGIMNSILRHRSNKEKHPLAVLKSAVTVSSLRKATFQEIYLKVHFNRKYKQLFNYNLHYTKRINSEHVFKIIVWSGKHIYTISMLMHTKWKTKLNIT